MKNKGNFNFGNKGNFDFKTVTKDQSVADHLIKKKSPAKNYKNPQDYKVFNFGNKPTPVKKKTYTKKAGTGPTGKYTKKEKTIPTGYYDSDETNKYTGKQARYGYASPTGDPYVKKTGTPPAFDSPAPKDPKYSGPLYKKGKYTK